MINGSHVIVYSRDAGADRAFFRDVLGFPSVDAGHGWLIFALPPAEAAFHPDDGNPLTAPLAQAQLGRGSSHELYLMCDDVKAEITRLAAKGVECSKVHEERWGSITRITLPGGSKLGLYQPRHPTAIGLK